MTEFPPTTLITAVKEKGAGESGYFSEISESSGLFSEQVRKSPQGPEGQQNKN